MIALFEKIPHWFIAFVGRFSIAAVFWKSGQTKVENFTIDIVAGNFSIGIPRMAQFQTDIFRDEFGMPLPALTAFLTAVAEHVFPVLILIGLATRFSALALLVMTMVIQIFVYPSAYPTHGVWAAVLLHLMARGPGALSLDHLVEKRYA